MTRSLSAARPNEVAAGPIIEALNLSVGYGRRCVVRDVCMTVNRGDFWFLLGPNGEGKTTFFRTLLGVLKPFDGVIRRCPEFDERGFVGFVPQRSLWNRTLPTTVSEFITLGLAGLHLSRREINERVESSLARVGLIEAVGRNWWSLSGGQRQRVLVARALARRPRLLLVDEPTNGLDPAAKGTLLRSLAAIRDAQETTILFITHELRLAAVFASHVALFHEGKVEVGSKEHLLTAARLTAIWGEDAALEIGATVVDEGVEA